MLDLSKGVIAVFCGDGDQVDDRYNYFVRMVNGQCPTNRIHVITRHGGALRLVKDSPLNTPGRKTDLDLLDEIAEAMELKGINVVSLGIHGPCGKATKHGLTLRQSTELLFEAKQRVKSELRDLGVCAIAMPHIDYGTVKKTYYACRKTWLAHYA